MIITSQQQQFFPHFHKNYKSKSNKRLTHDPKANVCSLKKCRPECTRFEIPLPIMATHLLQYYAFTLGWGLEKKKRVHVSL